MDHCEECGFDYDLSTAKATPQAIRDGVAEMAAILRGPHDLRLRRQENAWSPLEYGCHMRDVLLVQRERVLAARRTDTPADPPMGRDERVEHDGYSDQHPDDVARQLTDAALMFANVLDRLDPAGWQRGMIYNFPAKQERSMEWVAVHTLHEVRHHLQDIQRQLP